MKKLSIKLRITLWFTVFMIILAAVVFTFIALVSNSETSQQTRGTLVMLVEANAREVEYDDNEIDIEDEFVSFRNGVYCLVFDHTGTKISGNAPYAALEREPFENGSTRAFTISGEAYLLYDRLVSSHGEPDIWVRGVVAEGSSTLASSAVYRATLFALPLLILLAAAGGYLLARRSLRPIQKIGQTAEEIGFSGDLSKRIEMEGGNDELYQLAETFNHMFERLETNFEAERSFTADASHELRTPVTTILAQCEYAFENAANEQELYEAVGAIQKQGYRMSRLIESLLQFTRIEQRTESMVFDDIDLSALIASVCAEQAEAGEKNITLLQDIQPGITMKADRTLIARATENLIRNAYRYGKENGTTTVLLQKTGYEIVLSVTDNGIGIAAPELPKIWNRFYRADKSRSAANGTGLGLGLAMVKQIAALHGGRVQVQSTLGQGSVFTMLFTAFR